MLIDNRVPGARESVEKVGDRIVKYGENFYLLIVEEKAAELKIKYHEKLAERLVGLNIDTFEKLKQYYERNFRVMEGNVEAYLDWYYSLKGEYSRLTKLLLGQIEDYMAEKLNDILMTGLSTKGLETVFNEESEQLVKIKTEMAAEFQQDLQKLLANYKIDPSAEQLRLIQTGQIQIEKILPEDAFSAWAPTAELLSFKSRLAISGGTAGIGGLAAGIIAGKIASKVAGKAVFKLAAKSVAKAAASKAIGAGAGAAAGAAIGSVVPGPGTVIGGAVGLAVGFTAGLLVDTGLLVLEEAVSREEFKREILNSINEQKAETGQGLEKAYRADSTL
jgi:hypothetical protein